MSGGRGERLPFENLEVHDVFMTAGSISRIEPAWPFERVIAPESRDERDRSA